MHDVKLCVIHIHHKEDPQGFSLIKAERLFWFLLVSACSSMERDPCSWRSLAGQDFYGLRSELRTKSSQRQIRLNVGVLTLLLNPA